ncbi:MAG: hypothetical protein VKL23_09320 [Cyanobacteriota bacterium]|jgi:hypothetical protein|nr:hypothetical protein [Cyanobacteriota bacterium]
MPPTKLWNLLVSWALALALSAALGAAGERWPESLVIRPALVWSLVLLPPLLVASLLLLRWRQQAGKTPAGEGGESGD